MEKPWTNPKQKRCLFLEKNLSNKERLIDAVEQLFRDCENGKEQEFHESKLDILKELKFKFARVDSSQLLNEKSIRMAISSNRNNYFAIEDSWSDQSMFVVKEVSGLLTRKKMDDYFKGRMESDSRDGRNRQNSKRILRGDSSFN